MPTTRNDDARRFLHGRALLDLLRGLDELVICLAAGPAAQDEARGEPAEEHQLSAHRGCSLRIGRDVPARLSPYVMPTPCCPT